MFDGDEESDFLDGISQPKAVAAKPASDSPVLQSSDAAKSDVQPPAVNPHSHEKAGVTYEWIRTPQAAAQTAVTKMLSSNVLNNASSFNLECSFSSDKGASCSTVYSPSSNGENPIDVEALKKAATNAVDKVYQQQGQHVSAQMQCSASGGKAPNCSTMTIQK